MLLKFALFSVVVIILGVASYVFVNNNFVSRKGQITITDKDLASQGGGDVIDPSSIDLITQDPAETLPVQGDTTREITRTLGDLSTISTTIDGYGNRTETRVFRSHPRLRMVVVQTAINGSKKAVVYAHLGGLKTFYGTDADLALNSTADEIANKAEIFETRLDKERRQPKLANRGERRLEPLPSSSFTINTDGSAPEVESGQSASRTANDVDS